MQILSLVKKDFVKWAQNDQIYRNRDKKQFTKKDLFLVLITSTINPFSVFKNHTKDV